MPEVNFDGLVGPTHSYAGLSYGNVASSKNQGALSNPRAAALQGLAKMEADFALAIRTAIDTSEEKNQHCSAATLSLRGPSSPDPCVPLSGVSSSALVTAGRPGLGARGFLCNMRTKGFYGVRAQIRSMDSQRAAVRIRRRWRESIQPKTP